MLNLTEKHIASLKPREGKKQYDVYDSKLPGLGLCYSNGGARTFFVFWRDSAGRNRRESIGRWDKGISVNEARSIARAKLSEVEAAKKAGTDAHAERRTPTLADLIERYLKYAPGHLAPSTLKQQLGILGRCFGPEIKVQKLSAFTREQIEDLHREIGDNRGKLAANNWLRLIRHMFYLAIDWKLCVSNPCARVHLFKENARTRHLVDDEPRRLDEALRQDPDWRWRAFFPLLLYSGLRKGELLTLTWRCVDFAQRTVTIERTKNGKTLTQPLVEPAMQILESLPSRGVSEFVFPGDKMGKPLSAPGYAWMRIRKRAGLPDLRIHDLRHSFASFLINASVPIEVVSKALNHCSLAMTQRYAHLANGTVRAAMERVMISAIPTPAEAPAPRVVEAGVCDSVTE